MTTTTEMPESYQVINHLVRKEMSWETKVRWAVANGLWDRYREEGLAYLEETVTDGQGISSSDVNHAAMDRVESELRRRLA